MRPSRQIFRLLLALALLSGCARGPRLIPEKTMTRLYMEFSLTDEWIVQHGEHRRSADTARVYEPILNRYGYTTDDYLHSVRHYMADPDRFSKQIREAVEQLEAEKQRLTELRAYRQEREAYFRHAPWDPVSFDDIDYLQRPVIPAHTPLWQRRDADEEPAAIHPLKRHAESKNIREIPLPIDGE